MPVYLKDHQVFGKTVVPAAAFVEMALAAGQAEWKTDRLVLSNLAVPQALVLSDDAYRSVQCVVTPALEDRGMVFRICSLEDSARGEDPHWMLHATGHIVPDTGAEPTLFDVAAPANALGSPRPVDVFYDECEVRGIHYGPSFRIIKELWVGENVAWGCYELPKDLLDSASHYLLHPVLLDAAIQVALALLPADEEHSTFLPAGLERIEVIRSAEPVVRSRARKRVEIGAVENPNLLIVDISLFDASGESVGELHGLSFQRATSAALQMGRPEAWKDWLFGVVWRPMPWADRGLGRAAAQTDVLPAPRQWIGSRGCIGMLPCVDRSAARARGWIYRCPSGCGVSAD